MLENGHYLVQGELYFGDDVNTISTLLGSCVAVIIWHPKLKIGGMCHIVLPRNSGVKFDNRYADCAISTFSNYIKRLGINPREFTTNVYGGGCMFQEVTDSVIMVGNSNIEATKLMLVDQGFKIDKEETGGQCYRKVKLTLKTGEVRVKTVSIDSAKDQGSLQESVSG